MKILVSSLLFFVFCTLSAQVLVINELDSDNPSTDTAEFVEIKSQTPNFSTDGYILVFFNGSTSGNDSSYLVIDLNGYTTDNNGLLVIGSAGVGPFPQLLISENLIQNGADAVAIYQDSPTAFPEGTMANITNLIDVLIYDTSDPDDLGLIDIFNDDPNFASITQINEGSSGSANSIQRNNDGSYFTATPTPRRLNDGSGNPINPITISVSDIQIDEGASLEITFTSEVNVTSDLNFDITLNNFGFNTSDYAGSTSLTIANGQNSISTTILLVDDTDDEGDEVLEISFINLIEPIVPFNNKVEVRVVDNDFTMAPWGTPVNPTFGQVTSTQPTGYYNSLDGLSGVALRQALQNIIANPSVVRAQTYADVFDILKEADQNPENSNQVWLVYSEEGRAKLDLQTTSSNAGKWNREHTFPRSLGGFNNIEDDEIADGINIFWETKADSLRHANSDAHALRAADAAENSSRGNQHYGQYIGPSGTLGSFRGDVARGVLYLEIRYNGLEVVNGFPSAVGQIGDLDTLLDWHRNDPPDDYEMNRNNLVYNWQYNRNPFIDQPELVEYIWGNNVGENWDQTLSIEEIVSNDLTIYPNPSNGHFQIKGLNKETQIDLYTIDGKLLSEYYCTGNYVDLNVSSGIYIIKLKQGNRIYTKKLIIN
ncbi:endonuclease [Winogradskyella sp. KYW1333]|uniref:endonuclease n=1 Tax=Winogradskyella sp. KYW1333 TaxID=2282123 RepID=UPI000DF163F7|nr:endonuclease [Winogradskyella sp. KYW1333]RCT56234.1 T9SS C-terminal target domain-containing protein [Winogradskyella sp. KYW1333]